MRLVVSFKAVNFGAFFFFFFFLKIAFYVYECLLYMCAGAWGNQKVSDPPELEL